MLMLPLTMTMLLLHRMTNGQLVFPPTSQLKIPDHALISKLEAKVLFVLIALYSSFAIYRYTTAADLTKAFAIPTVTLVSMYFFLLLLKIDLYKEKSESNISDRVCFEG